MEKYRFNDIEFAQLENSCIPLAVYQFIDKRVVTIALSQGFCELLGYERDEAYYLMDNDMYRDSHPDDVARIANAAFLFATEEVPYDVIYRSKVGDEYRIIHALGKHVLTDTGVRLAYVWYTYEGVYTEENQNESNEFRLSFNTLLHEQSIYQSNYYDHLTGLPSMTYFFELADAGRRRLKDEGKQVAILFFNLNGMQFYNHKHGFSAGDKLIKDVAKVLVKYFSNENCSRFAKDHFAAYCDAANLEQTLKSVFADCKAIDNGDNLPVRVGIYLDKMGSVDIGSACDRAQYACNLNRAAYQSDYQYFNEEMLVDAENRRYFVKMLDTALNEGWVKVYYQAIVRTATGKSCDEEALSRWDDPERGFLSPAEFIPALEDARVIYKLDLYVVEQILKKIKAQEEAGLYVVPQSVNLSRTDFDAVDMVEEIRKRVDAAGIDRDKITIEITESVVGSDFEFMKEQIERFQSLGFPVWMDDFGSGYSSLDVLQHIHFDVIKLDMRFLEGFDEGDEGKIIITELINMASGLGIGTVAEGVETKEQVEFLREVGCMELQGYYFTKPLTHEEIVDRQKSGRAQIGFENPAESEYYASIGRINLYDVSSIAQEDNRSYGQYFDTMPAAIYEVSGDSLRLTRSNKSYRDFMKKSFGVTLDESNLDLPSHGSDRISLFVNTLRHCSQDGNPIVLDEDTGQGETSHTLIKRIAVNPVTGTTALIVAVLALVSNKDKQAPISFVDIAKALSSDYQFLFYVNLDTEEFVEYSSGDTRGGLAAERRGENFFEASRQEAIGLLDDQDIPNFQKVFTKENVVSTIDEQGAFITPYRQYANGELKHMVMKAVRMSDQENHIIIGVSDVDSQMKERQTMERVMSEQAAYTRISALSDDYLCIYIVDLETEEFEEYSSMSDYAGLGIAKHGNDFFNQSRIESAWALVGEDSKAFQEVFVKEHVVEEIKRNKSFTWDYHLLINGEPMAVSMKAVLVEESDGTKLVIGVR